MKSRWGQILTVIIGLGAIVATSGLAAWKMNGGTKASAGKYFAPVQLPQNAKAPDAAWLEDMNRQERINAELREIEKEAEALMARRGFRDKADLANGIGNRLRRQIPPNVELKVEDNRVWFQPCPSGKGQFGVCQPAAN